MNLHPNKTRRYFSKDFYLQHKALPCCSSHWLGGGWVSNEKVFILL